MIKQVLHKFAEPLLAEKDLGKLEIESVELLTREKDPRTKCWRVVVPYTFKEIMEDGALYPVGWRYRQFFGVSGGRGQKKSRQDQILEEALNNA